MTLPQLSPMLPGTTLGTSSQPQFTCQLLQALGALRRLGWQEPGKLEGISRQARCHQRCKDRRGTCTALKPLMHTRDYQQCPLEKPIMVSPR